MRQLSKQLEQEGIDCWGICAFEETLLLPHARRNRLPAAPASVVVLLCGYDIGVFPVRNLAQYAIPDDYHTLLGDVLARLSAALEQVYPGERFVPFVDASPLAEVAAAVRAGLGERGRNGLLLNDRYGSRCLIATLVTTLALPISPPVQHTICSGCGACLRACPTGALGGPCFAPERCRSQITQKKGTLSDWEQEQIAAGGLAWGCDLCSDACPLNRTAEKSGLRVFYENPVPMLTRENAAALCARKAYGWRGELILQRNLEILEKERSN